MSNFTVKVAGVAALVLVMAAVSACGERSGAPGAGVTQAAAPVAPNASNPLIGRWKAKTECTSTIEFTPTQQVITDRDVVRGGTTTSTTDVTYNTADPSKVYVLGNAGAVGYFVHGLNEIQLSLWPSCVYERIG